MIYGRLARQPELNENISTAGQVAVPVGSLLIFKAVAPLVSSTAAAIGLGLGASLLAPLALDLLVLPFTASADKAHHVWGINARDVKHLQSRSVPAWSLNPKEVKQSARFQTLLMKLLEISLSRDPGATYSPHVTLRKKSKHSNFVEHISFNVDPSLAARLKKDSALAFEAAVEEVQ